MLRVVIFGCLLATTLSFDTMDLQWKLYKSIYKKQYDARVEPVRRYIWESNMQYIERHNMEAKKGLHSFTLGMNEFGDMTPAEFVNVMTGVIRNVTEDVCIPYVPPAKVKMTQLPDEIDWRDFGYVTPVKYQGDCGSCWTFSSTGAIEGQNFKKNGELVSLSEQNLVDCASENGCSGGWMGEAFAYVITNGGIDTEESYPYVAEEQSCQFQEEYVGAIVTGCKNIMPGSEQDLQSAVGLEGPISVTIDASKPSFQFYSTGVYNEVDCSTSTLNHAVLAVGYGNYNGDETWIVKNSWGTSWGDNGYILMSRNKNNQCGIATAATFPTM